MDVIIGGHQNERFVPARQTASGVGGGGVGGGGAEETMLCVIYSQCPFL